MPLESISLFPSPNAPDLGCFVRRKHELEMEEPFHNIHVELNPSIDSIHVTISCTFASRVAKPHSFNDASFI